MSIPYADASKTVAEQPLLSRVADSVYWMARYIERAENVARFVNVNVHLMLDLPEGNSNQWQPLIDTSGDAAVFRERAGEATHDSVVEFLTFDEQNPNSIVSCVRGARENARSVRETISSEMWEQANELYLLVTGARGKLEGDMLPSFFHRVRMACHLFHGITDVTMTHNEAWHFMRLGRKLERADKTTRLLDVKYFILLPELEDVGTPYDDIQWAAVLKSVSGFEMYRKRHGRIVPARIAEFLLNDPAFPRAVRYCVGCADQSLHTITGSSFGAFSVQSEQRLGLLRSELDYMDVAGVIAGGLHEFLDGLQTRMNNIDECIHRDFFAVRS
ncbi:MAG: alpha-E domain-containing protein [Bryobacteraceae bacterium]